MAYFIFNNNSELYRIAENDSEKNNLNINDDSLVITKTVNDEDFNKVKSNMCNVTLNEGNVTLTEINYGGNVYNSSEILFSEISNRLKAFKDILKRNSNHPRVTDINNYITVLENFNVSTLTFPLDKTWEKYCEDNSITYINPLQVI